jgi:hypothetical protein
MAAIPTQKTPVTPSNEPVEQRFRFLAETWKKAVAHLSSTTKRNSHAAYQEIISLGPEVVPLLLRDMQNHLTHWFFALHAITGVNPVPPAAEGNVPLMVDYWLAWAKENGYQW